MSARRTAWLVLLGLLGAGCAASTCSPVANHTVIVDPSVPGAPLSRALLGQYDLSGELFAYDQVPGLVAAMDGAGFGGSDWRVGLGRWEVSTQRLPELSDGTPCPFPIPEAFAPAGWADDDLIASRDWFTDDGLAVTAADTLVDARYELTYVRQLIDVASAFGANPFLSVDLMPRALAANATPLRQDCEVSFMNRVSNVRPADPVVFGLAVRGMVERLVEGHAGEAGRPLTHVELWNEPELAFFWDPGFEDGAGPLDRYFEAMLNALVQLDAMRMESSNPDLQELKIGLGSFAASESAVAMLAGFDDAVLPTGGPPPLDFVSFHSYRTDPLGVVDAIADVAAAAAATSSYADVELVLAEWGANLQETGGDVAYASSMDPALHAATVLAEGAALGLDRAHHAIFFDFYDVITFGLLDNAAQPKPLYHAYALLAEAISGAGELLPIAAAPNGRLSDETSLLASRETDGTVRLLFVHRGSAASDVALSVTGLGALPSHVEIFEDPAAGPASAAPGAPLRLPPRSIVLVRFDP